MNTDITIAPNLKTQTMLVFCSMCVHSGIFVSDSTYLPSLMLVLCSPLCSWTFVHSSSISLLILHPNYILTVLPPLSNSEFLEGKGYIFSSLGVLGPSNRFFHNVSWMIMYSKFLQCWCWRIRLKNHHPVGLLHFTRLTWTYFRGTS